MKPTRPEHQRTVLPSEEHAALCLREGRGLMLPLVRWLLRHGVSYTAFADMLKGVFVEVAREEIVRGGTKPTHSALSVLSGVHRKDVRLLADAEPHAGLPRHIPIASQLFTRWLTDPVYAESGGKPRRLPRQGAEASFETLARQLSSDVHPRTLLEELLRLGLVQLDGDDVVPQAAAFVPAAGLAEMTALFSANAGDHIAAAVHNLTEGGPKFLEQSVFANGLTQASAKLLEQTAREAWSQSFEKLASHAKERLRADADSGENQRIRYGVYFYSEPVAAAPSAPAADGASESESR